MNRTRILFVSILAVAILIVGATLLFTDRGGGGTALTVQRPEIVELRILASLPVEPWVRSAADAFNRSERTVDGVPVRVQIEAVDGLTALGRWDRNEFGALEAGQSPDSLAEAERQALDDFPVAWIPDSRYLVELANAAYKERLGRDVFLTDGEYRARPIAISLFTWGLYASRAQVLEARYGAIGWQAIHDAATAAGGWPELGGEPGWGFFKLVVPNPSRNVGGLAARIAAAGEYYGRTDIAVEGGLCPFRLQCRRWRPAPRERSSTKYAGYLDALGGPIGPLLSRVRHLVRLPLLGVGGTRDDRAAKKCGARVPTFSTQ